MKTIQFLTSIEYHRQVALLKLSPETIAPYPSLFMGFLFINDRRQKSLCGLSDSMSNIPRNSSNALFKY
jgi:hypothetical protein